MIAALPYRIEIVFDVIFTARNNRRQRTNLHRMIFNKIVALKLNKQQMEWFNGYTSPREKSNKKKPYMGMDETHCHGL